MTKAKAKTNGSTGRPSARQLDIMRNHNDDLAKQVTELQASNIMLKKILETAATESVKGIEEVILIEIECLETLGKVDGLMLFHPADAARTSLLHSYHTLLLTQVAKTRKVLSSFHYPEDKTPIGLQRVDKYLAAMDKIVNPGKYNDTLIPAIDEGYSMLRELARSSDMVSREIPAIAAVEAVPGAFLAARGALVDSPADPGNTSLRMQVPLNAPAFDSKLSAGEEFYTCMSGDFLREAGADHTGAVIETSKSTLTVEEPCGYWSREPGEVETWWVKVKGKVASNPTATT